MKIRSITCFVNPGRPLKKEIVARAGSFAQSARTAFQSAGFEVQTIRLAIVPFPKLVSQANEALLLAQTLEEMAATIGFEYLSLGPALPEAPWSYALAPEILARTRNVFISGAMTTQGGEISLLAVRACADIIHRAAPLSPDGFANLRFAALANVPPGSPFFPAAYHRGRRLAFALATEAADLAVQAFTQADTLDAARSRLVALIEENAQALSRVAEALSKKEGFAFNGIDFSLAPYPEQAQSLGKAFEQLGVPAVGLHGSLAAAALVTESIDRARFPRVGFSGLMLPVLEDSVLASRAAQGLLSVKDLLLYSAVCGTGLDTVPLPGDTSPEALAAVLLDLAVLAHRLDKPLTARLMPVPGKLAGEPTGFDFAFFENSRVLPLQAQPLTGVLAGQETFFLHKRT